MRKGIATPEINNGPKLTMVVQTRSPLEAFNMLRMGHPIDLAAGYYHQQGIQEEDFFMQDQIGKLHALARYKEMVIQHKTDVEDLQRQAKAEQEVTKQQTDNGEAKNT